MSEPTIDEMIALMKQFAAAGKPVLGYAIEREQMTEPTIDEMLEWFDSATSPYWVHWKSFESMSKHERDSSHEQQCHQAIRAILEQHRASSIEAIRAVISEERGRDLLIIRAFVERVEKRGCWNGECALRDELAAMEKEAE